MNRFFVFLTALLCLSAPAFAADEAPSSDFTGNVALTSDYVFRGISQSNEEPTIQGGMDWKDSSGTGLYAGIWGSGVDFNDATTEIDLYGGISGTVADFDWTFGAIYYYYPGADDSLNYDFWELAASVGYDFNFMQTTLSLNYSPDNFASSGDAWYPSLSVKVPLPHNLSANANLAHQWVSDNTAVGTPDYTTWSVGLDYDATYFILGLKYSDTDMKEPTECADGCGQRVVVTVSRSF